ncbi:hypothetical protein D2T29_10715 [Sinirhodobacter populi]|uniref:Uncharacterized protein n=1 Tax=Paenirhodobacter populi TaxID=2306993 RepID=A0A443KFG9_9RHOB|nr:hypothetical protein [Sinirhodobacter populi]RWR31496.1 hypothetical protein D2T29_10715 [Sinirhodobacter populi]
MPNPVPATAPGLPVTLHEIRDCLVLALDATEKRRGYTLTEREARSYMRSALRRVDRLTEVRA